MDTDALGDLQLNDFIIAKIKGPDGQPVSGLVTAFNFINGHVYLYNSSHVFYRRVVISFDDIHVNASALYRQRQFMQYMQEQMPDAKET